MTIRIGEIPMECRMCGHKCAFQDCEPDCDGDGGPGCPLSDCGGLMRMLAHENLLGHVEAQP